MCISQLWNKPVRSVVALNGLLDGRCADRLLISLLQIRLCLRLRLRGIYLSIDECVCLCGYQSVDVSVESSIYLSTSVFNILSHIVTTSSKNMGFILFSTFHFYFSSPTVRHLGSLSSMFLSIPMSLEYRGLGIQRQGQIYYL